MAETVGDWLALVDELYPPMDASDWDVVGLQVGDPAWRVERVLVALDVTPGVVADAGDGPATLVLAHHPLLFLPLARLTPDTASGRTALLAAASGVAVAAAHTNLDVAGDGAGTSDPVVRLLGLSDVRPLTSRLRDGDKLKLATFVPPEAVERVLDAVAAAGAGRIGDYDRCSFRVLGMGTFRPTGDADPYSGQVGQDNAEEEYRLEVELPRHRAGAVIRALVAAHPYDEAAYDLYPAVTGADVGFGRVGALPVVRTVAEVAARIRDGLPAPHLRYAGDPDRRIASIAVVGGAGDSLIPDALAAGVDAYVTGDLRHHVTLDAVTQGLVLIDAGHHATEAAALPTWIERLTAAARHRGLSAHVVASTVSTVPWND